MEGEKLHDFVEFGLATNATAAKMNKTFAAVEKKSERLGLVDDDAKNSALSSSSHALTLPKDLPILEDFLKILAGASKRSLSQVLRRRIFSVFGLRRL